MLGHLQNACMGPHWLRPPQTRPHLNQPAPSSDAAAAGAASCAAARAGRPLLLCHLPGMRLPLLVLLALLPGRCRCWGELQAERRGCVTAGAPAASASMAAG